MYQSQSQRIPTDAEKAVLTAYSTTGNGNGKTPAQMAAELNDSNRVVPNPALTDPAKAVPKAVITKSSVQNLLTFAIMELLAVPTPDAVKLSTYKYIQEQVNAHAGDYSLPDVEPYAQRMISDSLITATSMHDLTTNPDPAYQPTIAAGPLAFQLFGENVVVEVSDFS